MLKYMSSDEGMFGPGTDLIIKLLGVVIMMYAIQQKKHDDGVKYFHDNQIKFIKEVYGVFSVEKKMDSIKINEQSKISTKSITKTDDTITIENNIQIQRCLFGATILFEEGQHNLSPAGKIVFEQFGIKLKENINLIKEIQIQGHADNQLPSKDYASNVELAYKRANEVFEVLKNDIGISPYENLISVVSYGDSRPVRRTDSISWTAIDNNLANSNKIKQSLNRRIEIVLIYKENRKKK